jgi:hypothetical protein
MKKSNYSKVFSTPDLGRLMHYIKTEVSYQNLRKILLFDSSIYGELFGLLCVEQTLVNKHEEFIVLEQKLMDTSRQELIQLIKKTIPHDRLIEILTFIMS